MPDRPFVANCKRKAISEAARAERAAVVMFFSMRCELDHIPVVEGHAIFALLNPADPSRW